MRSLLEKKHKEEDKAFATNKLIMKFTIYNIYCKKYV